MLSLHSISCCTALTLTALGLVQAQYLPDSNSITIREFEHIYLDSGAASLVTAVQPCAKYTDPQTGKSVSTTGRQSAAEWVRTAFRKSIATIIMNAVSRAVLRLFDPTSSVVSDGEIMMRLKEG